MTQYRKKHDITVLPQGNWHWRIIKAGHTQKSFAAHIGKHEGQLSEWLNGIKMPGPANRKHVEDALKELGV